MPQKNVIILTQDGDVHACAVDYVLKSLGVNCHIVNLNDVLIDTDISVSYVNDSCRISIGDYDGLVSQVTSSWNRRISSTGAYNIPNKINRNDIDFVKRNTNLCVNGILSLLDERFPVNFSHAIYVSANKARQLNWARRVGLKVPETLISNKPSEIIDFLGSDFEACVKPYSSYSWRTEKSIAVANNAIITANSISDPDSVRVMPHIYQRYIRKKAEYRLTLFGSYAICTKIDTTKLDSNSQVDWRSSMGYLEHLENVEIPPDVLHKSRRLLKELGLRFGTLDFAVDDDSNIFFLEVNQAGQWLWQEQHCPGSKLLEPFARYLMDASDGFTWDTDTATADFDAVTVLERVVQLQEYSSLLDPQKAESKSSFSYIDERPQPANNS